MVTVTQTQLHCTLYYIVQYTIHCTMFNTIQHNYIILHIIQLNCIQHSTQLYSTQHTIQKSNHTTFYTNISIYNTVEQHTSLQHTSHIQLCIMQLHSTHLYRTYIHNTRSEPHNALHRTQHMVHKYITHEYTIYNCITLIENKNTTLYNTQVHN